MLRPIPQVVQDIVHTKDRHCGVEMRRKTEFYSERFAIEDRCMHCGAHYRELRTMAGTLLRWQNLKARVNTH